MTEYTEVEQEEGISWEKFKELFEGKEIRFGLVRYPGAIMEQWADLGSLADIAAWAEFRGEDKVTVESMIRDLKDVLGETGPMICVYIVNGESVLVNPADGKIYPNWE